MPNRTDIDTYEKMISVGQAIMADGLIQGKGFASIISEIMHLAAAYGADEANRTSHFMASVAETDFDELKASLVLRSTEQLFEGTKLRAIIQQTVLAAAAFGFQGQRQREKAA